MRLRLRAGSGPQESLQQFLPARAGGPGIEVAYFNMREGRLRQSNLHFARPGRIGARELIEEMYEHRHQREFGTCSPWASGADPPGGGARIFFWYSLIHLSGLLDRWGWKRLADWLRTANTLARTEGAISRLLQARCRFVVTGVGGCAIDVDTEEEYDAVKARFDEWTLGQQERVRALHGAALEAPRREGRQA